MTIKELLKNIKYQTYYIGGSYSDVDMLSRMSIEDDISPFSIDKDIDEYCRKNNIDLNESDKPIQLAFPFPELSQLNS